ncbi:MAG: winged helix-turn-helix transcriptional regulator [Gammaproteobacteria bacterium]|nr:winged helix-turn-helix transcriptional regulator [Gammaproteobacteria bacterium]
MRQDSVSLLKLLGNPYRLQIAYLLAQGEQTNESMIAATGLSAQCFTHHLTRFRNRGFVEGRRNGRNVIYSLHDPVGGVSKLLNVLAVQYKES